MINLYDSWVVASLFSPEECDAIKEIGERRKYQKGTTGASAGAIPDPAVRDSDVCWLHQDGETQWIYNRLMEMVDVANKQKYQVHLMNVESLQLTRYGEKQHYDWHMDCGVGHVSRKLSCTVALDPPDSYEGGKLDIMNFNQQFGEVPQGTAIVFPSFCMHRVSPVLDGTRHSLVSWFVGREWV